HNGFLRQGGQNFQRLLVRSGTQGLELILRDHLAKFLVGCPTGNYRHPILNTYEYCAALECLWTDSLRSGRLDKRLHKLHQSFAFGDSLGMKLKIDPLLQPHFFDCFDIASPGTESQPIERMQSLLVVRDPLLESAIIRLRSLSREDGRAGGQKRESLWHVA